MWSLNIAILVVPFVYIGHKGYPILIKLTSRIHSLNIFIITIVGILFFVFLATQFNIQSNIMGNIIPPFYSFYGMAILGSLIVFCISFLIDNLNIIPGSIILARISC